DPEIGSVYAYNYCDGTHYSACFQNHNGGDLLNLYEGNNTDSVHIDSIHGTHFMNTYFRNHLDGGAHNGQSVAATSGFALDGHARFFNIVGNVFSDPSTWGTYETVNVDSGSSIYNLGFKGNCSNCSGLSNDSNVKRTLLRWGNWDNVTNTVRWLASEVPSAIASYPNPLPGNQILPASLYRLSKPAFFGSVAWPPIGPDVTGGNISGTGGHANKIPARLCFEAAPTDAAYSSSSPRIRAFDPAACYADGGGGTVPTAPTNLHIVP
ncbi:MAG TPA: hypothetical protein VK550_19945, partial [Polyangiaceae bacterium]|nr:hypothetical protein [Polyangiaceae bacterium]